MKCAVGISFLILLCQGLAFPAGWKGLLNEPQATSSTNKLRDVDWWTTSQQKLAKSLHVGLSIGEAKNVILFIGDGMGVSTVSAARVYKAQQEGRTLHDTTLSWEDFPFASLAKTYNVDQITSDSAGTGTALLTGIKTNHGMIGLSQEAIRTNCTSSKGHSLKTILDYSREADKWTGVVSTARITHATPASSYAATPERDWEADSDIPSSEKGCVDIATQLVEDNDFIRVIFGGGRQNFLPKEAQDPEYPTYKNRREDGRNLMNDWESKLVAKVGADKVKLVTNNTGFNAIDPNKVEYTMGLFEPSHMQYELDRNKGGDGEPSLSQMVEKAIKILRRSEKGYFLLVEGGRIDHAHHSNKARKALTETTSLSEAVAKAAEMTSETDTLITVTADHSHVFTMGGYPAPGSDILGVSQTVKTGTKDELVVELAGDGMPWLPLSYANGPGHLYHRTNGTISEPLPTRRDLTEDFKSGKTNDKDYRQDAAVYQSSETHAGEEVGVYARGPMSHLFRGTLEQSYIAHVLMFASCVGPNQDHCTKQRVFPDCALSVGVKLGATVTKVFLGMGGCLLVLRRLFY